VGEFENCVRDVKAAITKLIKSLPTCADLSVKQSLPAPSIETPESCTALQEKCAGMITIPRL
jgi:hypothetical protein